MSSNFRLVHLTSVHRPFDVRIFDKHCRTSVEAGDEVVLVARHNKDEVVDGVAIKAVKARSNRLLRMTLTTWQVFRIACNQKADLYVIHDPELLPWARLLQLLGRTVVYDMHENVPKDILSKAWIPSWLRRPLSSLMKISERCLVGGMPVIFAESSYAQSYPWVAQSVVVRNFAKLSLFEEIDRGEASPSLAYVGAVSRDRGSVATLEALTELKRRGVKVGWTCVGPISPPAHEEELRTLIKEAGLSNIELTGYLPRPSAIAEISSSTIGVAILLPEPNFVESYPTKVFEYMAMGMPVVTSNFPLYREVIENSEGGICVDPTNPREIADAIQTLVEDPKLANHFGERGRQAVRETYNWDVEFGKLRAFYEQLLRDARSR